MKDHVFKKFKSEMLKTLVFLRKPVPPSPPHSSTLKALFTRELSASLLLTSYGDRLGDKELRVLREGTDEKASEWSLGFLRER